MALNSPGFMIICRASTPVTGIDSGFSIMPKVFRPASTAISGGAQARARASPEAATANRASAACNPGLFFQASSTKESTEGAGGRVSKTMAVSGCDQTAVAENSATPKSPVSPEIRRAIPPKAHPEKSRFCIDAFFRKGYAVLKTSFFS
jgi:hypothetical protein